ncbi:hypothetical protein [Glycomyces rhizosphaerae]|uniref:MFS transporter n=1 Tax=Glycomyces rhizosphaerae TaxID=2054422 RepID=A0ABV7PZL6_9ACTN
MTVDLGGAALPSENAFRLIMAIAAGAAVVALAIAAFLPRHTAEGAAEPAPVLAANRA